MVQKMWCVVLLSPIIDRRVVCGYKSSTEANDWLADWLGDKVCVNDGSSRSRTGFVSVLESVPGTSVNINVDSKQSEQRLLELG